VALASAAITNVPFADAVNDSVGSIGNRAAGFFSMGKKGLYSVDLMATYSTSWGPAVGLGIDLAYTDNQGGTIFSVGTQAGGPTPWVLTDNTFMIDHTAAAVAANREYMIRVYNYIAAMTMTAASVRVARVSERP
jgi:hypothetical protein